VVTGRLEFRPALAGDTGKPLEGAKHEPVVLIATIKLSREK
jgi:hypothetical protein